MEKLYTVRYVPGISNTIPMIRIQGKWLEGVGFRVADKMRVQVIDLGHLVIKRVESTETRYDQSSPDPTRRFP